MSLNGNKIEAKDFLYTIPDGHKLEIHSGSLQSRLESMEGYKQK